MPRGLDGDTLFVRHLIPLPSANIGFINRSGFDRHSPALWHYRPMLMVSGIISQLVVEMFRWFRLAFRSPQSAGVLTALLVAVPVEPAETVHVSVSGCPTVAVLLLAEILAVMGATPDSGTW